MLRRQNRKQATREDILAAARRLFAAHGWDGTTTKMVAADAGVAVGTVFLHFPDKGALLGAALHDRIARVLEEAFRTLPAEGLVAQLTHLAGALYTMYAEDPALSRVLVKESLFLVDGEAADAVRAQLERFSADVAGLIVAARGRGEADLDPTLGAAAFFSLYFAVLVAGLRDGLPVGAQLAMLRSLLELCFRPGRAS